MPLVVEKDEAADPLGVGLLCTEGKVVEAEHLPALIEQAGLGIRAERLTPARAATLPRVRRLISPREGAGRPPGGNWPLDSPVPGPKLVS